MSVHGDTVHMFAHLVGMCGSYTELPIQSLFVTCWTGRGFSEHHASLSMDAVGCKNSPESPTHRNHILVTTPLERNAAHATDLACNICAAQFACFSFGPTTGCHLDVNITVPTALESSSSCCPPVGKKCCHSLFTYNPNKTRPHTALKRLRQVLLQKKNCVSLDKTRHSNAEIVSRLGTLLIPNGDNPTDVDAFPSTARVATTPYLEHGYG